MFTAIFIPCDPILCVQETKIYRVMRWLDRMPPKGKPALDQQRVFKRAVPSARQIFAELAISSGPSRNAIRQLHLSGSPNNRVCNAAQGDNRLREPAPPQAGEAASTRSSDFPRRAKGRRIVRIRLPVRSKNVRSKNFKYGRDYRRFHDTEPIESEA
jgi:hypothetical protein